LEVYTQKYGPPKLREFLFKEFRDSNLGIPRQNDIWLLALWPCTKNIIKGKVVASFKSELWWVLWVHVYLWFIHAPKVSNYALTNLLFGLCRSMWIIESPVILSSPYPRALTCPSPIEVLQARECTPIPYPSIVFTFELAIKSTKEFGDASIWLNVKS
jgi:hypothetical protein